MKTIITRIEDEFFCLAMMIDLVKNVRVSSLKMDFLNEIIKANKTHEAGEQSLNNTSLY